MSDRDDDTAGGAWTRPPNVGRRRGPVGVPRPILVLAILMAAIEFTLILSDIGVLRPGLRGWAYANFAFHDPLFEAALAGEWMGWRVPLSTLTYTMLHGGLIHLGFNGAALLGLGAFLSRRISAGRVIVAIFVTSVAGAVAFGLIAQATGPLVGASGGLFGLLGVLKRWEFETLRRTPGGSWGSFWRSLLGLVLLNVILAFAAGGALAWEAHLGGFAAGWALGMVLAKQQKMLEPRR